MLKKLGPIKTDLIRAYTDWKGWNFERLLTELRNYTIRNPEEIEEVAGRERIEKEVNHHHIKGFEASNKEGRRLIYIYCSAKSHLSSECDKAKTIQERKVIFKKLHSPVNTLYKDLNSNTSFKTVCLYLKLNKIGQLQNLS